ncbi:glycosyltransferase [Sphingomonas sp. Leaf21]|uniref:glycosyltransferase n=1 Tax=Sphingomonas sp. Leaf21 TaxID=2876550 RepID=UPI001E473437
MATYNGERYIGEQLRSIAMQRLLPSELVVCDDQSTDSTLEIVEDFARTAPFPVRVYRNAERLRFSENFMKAARLCRGRYIAFSDQDDVWHPHKIERSIVELERTGALMCTHPVDLIDQRGERVGMTINHSRHPLLSGDTFNPWGVFLGFTCTIDRRLLEMVDPGTRPNDLLEYDQRMAHDRWFYLVAGLFGSLCYVDTPLALYRQHDGNVFGRTRSTMVQRIAKATRKYPTYISHRQRIAASIARMLAERRDPDPAPGLAAATRRWTELATFYAMRHAAFSRPKRLARLMRLVSAYRHQAYRPGWGRGGRALFMQDAIAALIAR